MSVLQKAPAALIVALGLAGTGVLTAAQSQDDGPELNEPAASNPDQEASDTDQAVSDTDEEAAQRETEEATSEEAPATPRPPEDTSEANLSDPPGQSDRSQPEADRAVGSAPPDEPQANDPAERQEEDSAVRDEANRGQDRNVQGETSDTPPVPEQARNENRGDQANYDADWRMRQHRGEWWYYAPNGNWQYQRNGTWHAYHADTFEHSADYAPQPPTYVDGPYAEDGRQGERRAAGYRGEQPQGVQYSAGYGPEVRYDRCGRPYICENGRAVYIQLDETSYQSRGQQPTMADEPPPAPPDAEQSGQDSGQDQPSNEQPRTGGQDGSNQAPPAPPTPPEA